MKAYGYVTEGAIVEFFAACHKREWDEFKITDDNDAKLLLTELGIMSRFTKNPQSTPRNEPTTQAVVFNEHPTHHILAVLYLGHPTKEDNGYIVYCLPKRKYPSHEFFEFSQRVLNPQQVLGASTFSGPPTEN